MSYTPPKTWTWNKEATKASASLNRPTAGPRHEAELPVGDHRFQLHSLATPNGVKVTIMFEELLEAGNSDAEYDAWPIDIGSGDQFSAGFYALNPNSKIPALFDKKHDLRVFESDAILLYLAEQFNAFLPSSTQERTEALNWLFWLHGSAPVLGQGFGHFYASAPEKLEYPIDRFTMEVKRQLDVLDRTLENRSYLAGEEYSIADIATAPWYGALLLGDLYDAAEFLNKDSYPHVLRWTHEVIQRPAFKRGRMVNRAWGDPSKQLLERHSASDFANLPKA